MVISIFLKFTMVTLLKSFRNVDVKNVVFQIKKMSKHPSIFNLDLK